jgi:hypothetical protein
MKEKLPQVQRAICIRCKEICTVARTRMEAVDRAFNPYTLTAIFS